MDEKIVLRLRYIHREYVEIQVDDKDRCNILDIYVDLLEGAEKKGMLLPEEPTFWYAHNSQNFKVESDRDLMKMFSSLHDKKIINLAIGCDEKPCKVLELARFLIESRKQANSKSVQAPITKQPRSSHASISVQSHSSERKIPATSARRKGSYIPKATSTSQNSVSEPTSGNLSVVDGAMYLANIEVPSIIAQLTNGADVVLGSDIPSDEPSDDEVPSDDCQDGRNEVYFDALMDNRVFYEEGGFGKIELKEWMLFLNTEHMMDILRDYYIQEGFSFVVIKSEQQRYTAECGASECKWRIHTSRLADGVTWAIKTLKGTHTCLRLNMHNPMATLEWAATKILEDVIENENICGKALNEKLWKRFGINLKSMSLYKARTLALAKIRGDEDTSYTNLPIYCEELKRTNPGSKAHCVWKVVEDNPEKPIQFKSIFISLKPMVEGFIQGCRRLIAVDGAHLRAKYGGVLLAATAITGTNEIFPIAYGVYERETKETWSSFIYHMRELLKDVERDDLTIIADRQKGVNPTITDVWPTVSRRYCCNHLYANFKKKYPGEVMRGLFWKCCKAYSESAFRKAMEDLQNVGGLGAIKWLKKRGDMKCWARCLYNPELHSPETTSNWAESFNSTIGAERGLPVLTLLEGIRRTVMVRHSPNQKIAQTLPVNGITEHAKNILEVALHKSRQCEVFKAYSNEYEIKEGRSSFPVNIPNWSCSCGEWQMTGIPCRHAVRAIIEKRAHPADYVSHWFSTEMFKKIYSVNYRAVSDEGQWSEANLPKLIPPDLKRGVGRPSINRRRADDEKQKGKRSRTIRCGRCKAFGHNVKTCKGGLTAKEKKQHGIVVRTHKRIRKEKTTDEQPHSVNEVMSSAPGIHDTQ